MNSANVAKYQQCLFNSINHTGFAVELNNEHVPSKLTYAVGPSNAFWDLLYAQGSNNQFQNNLWYHVVFIKSGTTYTMYVNTTFDGSATVPASINYNQNVGIRFGSIGGGHEIFKGTLDDFGIWNRALTAEEIQQLYIAEVPEGCTDNTACNFNPEAGADDGSCEYAQAYFDCLGNCLNDFDGDGACDELEVPGCTYSFACNYNPLATQDNGSCELPEPYYDCAGNCFLDLNNNGLCDLEEMAGCTSPQAANYHPEASLDDGSCLYTCLGDLNNDETVDTSDLLVFLTVFGQGCP